MWTSAGPAPTLPIAPGVNLPFVALGTGSGSLPMCWTVLIISWSSAQFRNTQDRRVMLRMPRLCGANTHTHTHIYICKHATRVGARALVNFIYTKAGKHERLRRWYRVQCHPFSSSPILHVVSLSICLSICLSFSLFLSFYLCISICLFMYISI